MKLERAVADRAIKHSLDERPFEACGFLAGRDGLATDFYPLTNVERSPVLYMADSKEMFHALRDMDDRGIEPMAIFHSHTRSAAYPSETDVTRAAYPEMVYLIVSLRDEEHPELRGFKIVDGKVDEVDLDYT